MLHEILLALSGHPSSLFDPQSGEGKAEPSTFPVLSPSEVALLSSISRLADIHRKLRSHIGSISSSHPSTICRAVATTITSVYLARFQQKIIDVESKILRKDASTVGAYNIVPLAGVVGEFDEWTRLMDWLWELSLFMMPPKASSKRQDAVSAPCSGAQIVDKLRLEVQTGYADIEEAALTLEKVAETAWLRQMSTWVLYGRLPAFGGQDFFIQMNVDPEPGEQTFRSISNLLPKFVTTQTAASIMFIGKSLNHIRAHASSSIASHSSNSNSKDLALVPAHLNFLADISLPISPARLAEAINLIRISLSRNALQQLLPIEKIDSILTVLQEFFLLGRGEFAVSLVTEADERARSRQNRTSAPDKNGVRSLFLKEADVTAVLMRTWATLSSIQDDTETNDTTLDLARSSIHLTLSSKPAATRPQTPGRANSPADSLPLLSPVVFNDTLMTTPVSLTLDIASPLDLFLSPSEVSIYSSINAYLLAIRRAHLRLADLWRQSAMRREHPAPLGPPASNLPSGQEQLRVRRERSRARSLEMRKVWATCGAAVFLLAETGGYFEGEVIQSSWRHLKRWIGGEGEGSRPASSSASSSPSMSDLGQKKKKKMMMMGVQPEAVSTSQLLGNLHPRPGTAVQQQLDGPHQRVLHDPESLSTAHRLFITALASGLLVTDVPFTKALRLFLTHVDELIAFLTRLHSVHRNLDLAVDENMPELLGTYEVEEREVRLELDRARKRVDSDMKAVVGRLREIDTERIGSGAGDGVAGLRLDGERLEDGGYRPCRVGGVDRLLMKLDFGRMSNEVEDREGEERM